MAKRTEVYEVVEGTRKAPGRVLKSFTSAEQHKCGGPATACLRWFDRESRRTGAEMFFRKVA
jgi:hypothetical protein